GALSAKQSAELIADRLGGTVKEINPHRFEIDGTSLGTFKCELDSRFAHPSLSANEPDSARFVTQLRKRAAELFGDVASVIVPCEIVTPPIQIEEIARLDALLLELTARGATGTQDSIFYAFGVHFNPEIPTADPLWLLNVLRSQILLSDWLRFIMQIDPTRDLTSFAHPFSTEYASHVLDRDYAPTLDDLIDDYLEANPTRDRELDMLPLFSWLDEHRVRAKLPSEKISARPTFHYRMPNAALGDHDWSLVREWNRWVLIEQFADAPDWLLDCGSTYLRHLSEERLSNWTATMGARVIDRLQQTGRRS
ncbi:MAG: amidoligase family protein, partial [Pseudomonadota bacterium]